MKKVTTKKEALEVFELLNIKEVGKKFQHKRGTYVYELPFCTSYHNGTLVPIKFAVYKNGYVRRVEGAYTCYQINKQYKTKRKTWNSYYKRYYTYGQIKRVLIDNHEDRMVYLCNYILKNFYQTNKWSLIGGWTRKSMTQQAKDSHELYKTRQPDLHKLPFGDDGGYLNPPKDDIQVIINGHRYNLS